MCRRGRVSHNEWDATRSCATVMEFLEMTNYPFFLAFLSARFSLVVLAGFFLDSLRESWLFAMGRAPFW